jgi:hypothetical protein
MRLVGHVACTGKMRNAYKILVGKSEGKSDCQLVNLCSMEVVILIFIIDLSLVDKRAGSRDGGF